MICSVIILNNFKLDMENVSVQAVLMDGWNVTCVAFLERKDRKEVLS